MALSQVGLERLNTATTKKIGTNKNIIINGAMQVAQRGTSSTSVLDATLFERRILNKTKVELPLAVTNTVVLALRASVTTLALTSLLKVFAILS